MKQMSLTDIDKKIRNTFHTVKNLYAGKNRAISPVIGVILLVAIAVAVSVPVYIYVSTMPEPEPPVNAMLNLKYNSATNELVITHLSGTIINDAITTGSSGSGGGGVLYSEDFESGIGGWSISGQDYEWGRGNNFLGGTVSCCSNTGGCDPAPQCDEPSSAQSGDYALGTDIGGCYSGGSNNWGFVNSLAIDLSSASGTVTLSYWIAYQLEGGGFDTAKVEIASDSGFTSNLQEILTINPSDQIFQDWVENTYDVTSFSGGNLYLRVGMEADGSTCNWHWTGVYLDNVNIEDTGSGGGETTPAGFNNLIVTVPGNPDIDSITKTGGNDFLPGDKITITYEEDIISGSIISVTYKPANQLIKTLKI